MKLLNTLLLLSSLLLAVSVTIQAQTPTTGIQGMFNCNRFGMSCLGVNSTCNDVDGTCTCGEPELAGPDCSFNTTRQVTPCSCLNGGSCEDNGGTEPTCVCTDGYYGSFCGYERVSHVCRTDSMEITVVPFLNNDNKFTGIIYIYNQESLPGCVLDQVSTTDIYGQVINFTSCGEAATTNDTNGDIVRSFNLIIQYDNMILTAYDQQFVLKCSIKPSDSAIGWDDNMLESNPDSNLPKQEVTQDVRPVDLSLTLADDSPLDGQAVKIGDLLKMSYKFNGGSVYDSFKLMDVVATNGLTDSRKSTFSLITGGCVDPGAGDGPQGRKIVTNFSGDNTTIVIVIFKVFKLKYTSQVAFETVIKICKDTEGCNSQTCSVGSFPGVGRRRRAAEEFGMDYWEPDNDDFEKLNDKGIIVLIPGQTDPVPELMDPFVVEDDEDELVPCFRNAWFIIIIIVSLTISLMCGVATGVGIVCQYQNRSKKKRNNSVSSQAFDNNAYKYKY